MSLAAWATLSMCHAPQALAQDPSGGGANGLIRDLACVPDCPEVRFVNDWSYTDMEVCSGCAVRVKWTTRVGCGNNDVYVEEVTSINPNDPACMACFPGSLSVLVDQIVAKLLEVNPMGFPPLRRGDCVTNTRVVKGTCWMRHFPDFSSDYYNSPRIQSRIQACVGHENCCITNYQVCIDENGKRTVLKIGGMPESTYPDLPPATVCNSITLNASSGNQSYDCENVCNGTSR